MPVEISAPTLWEKIDTYLLNGIAAEMGADGLYGYLPVASVIVDDMFSFEQAVIRDEFPIVVVRSLDSSEGASTHGSLGGNGRSFLDHQYPYRIVTVVKVDGKRACRSATQTMRFRVLRFLATNRAFGGLTVGDGEEAVRAVKFEKTTVDLHGRTEADDATFYGITETYFTVESRG